MAFHHSPKIVTNGLVLCLDAANRKSYSGTGTVWRDLAGTNNGTLTNGPTFSSANGGSIVFDGVNDYTVISSVSNYRTITMWVYLNSKSTYLLDARSGSPNGYFWFPGGDAGGIGSDWDQFYINGNLVSRSFSSLPINTWFNFYVRNTANRTGTINLFSRFTNVEFQSGRYSIFMAHDRALTPAEILQNYNATKGRFNL